MVDKRRKLVHGVGINDTRYTVCFKINGKALLCPYYDRWQKMLSRCYNPKELKRHPTYKDCTVVEEWKLFSNFKKWMIEQDWKGKQLDKDILVPGNKVYGPDTCCFVSHALNLLLTDCRASRGKYPQGVCKHKGRFVSRISVDGERKNLGYFDTPEKAADIYNLAKANEIRRQADLQGNTKLKKALYTHALLYENETILT